jgi:hypothetical protein
VALLGVSLGAVAAPSEPADGGLFIGDDNGATWHRIFVFDGGVTDYTPELIDLDEEADAAGIGPKDHFLIKFQFYDNWPVEGEAVRDGYAIDDVIVYSDRYSVYLPMGFG